MTELGQRPDCKIFDIGIGRTGTTSLCRAMQILGYSAIHAPRSLEEIEKHDFCNDLYVASRYKFLDYLYPNAKFIVTIRDIDDWSASSDRKNKGMRIDTKAQILENRFRIHGMFHYDKKAWRSTFIRHYQGIMAYFSSRDVLYFDVQEGDGWKKLCKFLGKDVPSVPFPHLNESQK